MTKRTWWWVAAAVVVSVALCAGAAVAAVRWYTAEPQPLTAADVVGTWRARQATIVIRADATFEATGLPPSFLVHRPDRATFSGRGTWHLLSPISADNDIPREIELLFTEVAGAEQRSARRLIPGHDDTGPYLYYFLGDPDLETSNVSDGRD